MKRAACQSYTLRFAHRIRVFMGQTRCHKNSHVCSFICLPCPFTKQVYPLSSTVGGRCRNMYSSLFYTLVQYTLFPPAQHRFQCQSWWKRKFLQRCGMGGGSVSLFMHTMCIHTIMHPYPIWMVQTHEQQKFHFLWLQFIRVLHSMAGILLKTGSYGRLEFIP